MIRLPKNAREEIFVRHRSHKGVHTVDVRLFYRHASGEMRPTPKGVAIAIEDAPDLAIAIEQAARGPVDED